MYLLIFTRVLHRDNSEFINSVKSVRQSVKIDEKKTRYYININGQK